MVLVGIFNVPAIIDAGQVLLWLTETVETFRIFFGQHFATIIGFAILIGSSIVGFLLNRSTKENLNPEPMNYTLHLWMEQPIAVENTSAGTVVSGVSLTELVDGEGKVSYGAGPMKLPLANFSLGLPKTFVVNPDETVPEMVEKFQNNKELLTPRTVVDLITLRNTDEITYIYAELAQNWEPVKLEVGFKEHLLSVIYT